MTKKSLLLSALFLSSLAVFAQTNPAITSWLRNTTGITGRHYVSGNSTPITDAVAANVQTVQYSANSVYVSCTGIPSYITGPFLDGNPSLASNQNAIFKLPLNPVQNTGTPTNTTGGNIGIFINGVAVFDYRDGVSWKNSTNSLCGGPIQPPCMGDGVWNRDAVVAEKGGFDCSKGHPAMGNYHHHQNPSAFNLDLNVISTICSPYLADALYTINSNVHSPLIGYAYDGFPIYGPYAYQNTNGSGGIVRMKSSYSKRNITTRTTYSNGSSVTPGPAVSTTYPLGYFREDYEYIPTSAATPDYLDEHNGRFCVTPEYPNGIYCYFATVDANWNSAYPYLVGPTFYGVKTASKVTSISEPTTTYTGTTVAALAATISTTNVSCYGGSNGAINLNVTGGTIPYTFNWGNNITTQNRSNLTAGTYSVTITSANGQTTTYSSVITQPSTALTSTTTASNVPCFGTSTGAINVNPTGGTSPYSYNWGGGIATQNRTNIPAGTYAVTITDAKSCTTTLSKTITEPSSALSTSATVSNVTCSNGTNGSITLTATGGTTPYTFNWGNNITTQNRTNLAAGTYSVVITDANGCSNTASKTITQPTLIVNTAMMKNATCGNSNGTITINTTGGTSPYAYNWGNGITTSNPTALSAGNYTLTTTDANACTVLNSYSITNTNAPTVSGTVTNTNCTGGATGAITLSVASGTSPFTYNWSNGANTQNNTGLAAGTYTVTVSDVNACTTQNSFTVKMNNTPVASATVTNATCFYSTNGEITLNVNSGTAPYTYNWSNGVNTQNNSGLTAGTYTVTVSDANACTTVINQTVSAPSQIVATSTTTSTTCGITNGAIALNAIGGTAPYTYNWNTGEKTQNIAGLNAGTYIVTITDQNNCIVVGTATVGSITPLSATTSIKNVHCFAGSDGEISLNVIDGTAPYTYNWSNGMTTQNANGLVAGAYTVTITDAAACTNIYTRVIAQPIPIIVTATATNVNGNTLGTASVSASGGVSPYTYLWNNGFTTSNLTNLSAGTYKVTVTDSNGCTEENSTSVKNVTDAIDLFSDLSFKVFPNPASDLLFLQAEGLLRTSFEVKLVDVLGRVVLTKTFFQGSTVCYIETQTLYDGKYYLIITDGQKEKSFGVEIAH